MTVGLAVVGSNHVGLRRRSTLIRLLHRRPVWFVVEGNVEGGGGVCCRNLYVLADYSTCIKANPSVATAELRGRLLKGSDGGPLVERGDVVHRVLGEVIGV